jgi:acyl-CoA thioesterase-2
MPVGAPPPDDPGLENTGWGGLLDRRAVPMHQGWAAQWMRLLSDLPADPIVQACALVFMSDASPSSAARSSHPDSQFDQTDRGRFVGASLDHAIWYHRPTVATNWHWFEMDSHGLNGARGLVTGNVLDVDGRHVATVAQEVLLRRRRDPA